jgi:Ca2+-binding RTX toxin-like protein
MTGGAGNDSYSVDTAADKVIEAAGGGTDTVNSVITYTLPAEVERLLLGGTAAINGTGNGSANTITGNGLGNALSGGSGNDTLGGGAGNDQLDGGSGNDSLVGGTGNDGYVVDSTGDVISETSTLATEIDSVSASVTWTLGGNLERLTLTGSNPINGTGNTLANAITGNTGNNKISGGGGNDTLTGGAGLDTFRFSSALNGTTNVDTIKDFNPVSDAIELENSVFTKLTATGVLSTSFFRSSTTGTAVDSNDHLLYESDTGFLRYDADGSGAGLAVLVAKFEGLPSLSAADIFVT